ncbi:MAG: DMT family transporter [Calditrichaceae bacterium]|nr:DMT family transporter [Calditrichaceae bacterium]
MTVYLKLIFGILVLSWSSILIRWMGDIHPLIITFYRLAFSCLIILLLIKNPVKSVIAASNKHYKYLITAGIFLSMHFYTWITSLQLTTVGNSIFLESTHPLFGWLLSIVILREKISKIFIPSFIVAAFGMYFIISGDIQINDNALTGDFLAVFSAFFVAAYLIIARILKNDIDFFTYIFIVYGIAAVCTLAIILFKGINFWQIPMNGWLLLILMAIGPNLIGHSILNWASRKIPVYNVNMAFLSEAVLATIYAAILLEEIPPADFYIGAVLILSSIAGIFIFKK